MGYFRNESSKCPSNNPFCNGIICAEPFSCSSFNATRDSMIQYQLSELTNQSHNPANSYISKETSKRRGLIYDKLSDKKNSPYIPFRDYSTRNLDYKLNNSYRLIHPVLNKSGKSKFGYSGVSQDSYRNN